MNKTLLQFSLKLNEIMKLYIKHDTEHEYPIAEVYTYSNDDKQFKVILKNTLAEYEQIVDFENAFEIIREMCKDWNKFLDYRIERSDNIDGLLDF